MLILGYPNDHSYVVTRLLQTVLYVTVSDAKGDRIPDFSKKVTFRCPNAGRVNVHGIAPSEVPVRRLKHHPEHHHTDTTLHITRFVQTADLFKRDYGGVARHIAKQVRKALLV